MHLAVGAVEVETEGAWGADKGEGFRPFAAGGGQEAASEFAAEAVAHGHGGFRGASRFRSGGDEVGYSVGAHHAFSQWVGNVCFGREG